MLRLTAIDPDVVISELGASRVRFLLLEFIPAARCDVELGPGVKVLVPHHGVDELAPGIRARIEAIIGCELQVEDLTD